MRQRFTIASMLLVAGVTTLASTAVYISQEHAEDQLLLEMMEREVAEYARNYRNNPEHTPPQSTQLRSYIVDPASPEGLPPELRLLPPGIHHDIAIDGKNFQVANFTLLDKRFYLTYDITLIEGREFLLELALILGVLTATGLAGGIGWQLSRIVIAPVTRLSQEIKQLDPASAPPEFASRYSGAELGEIARAFDHYLKRLGEFVTRERAFAEDASHELRTPIAVINTAVELLAADLAVPEQIRPVVDRIGRAGRQMQGTVQSLLFLARETEPGVQPDDSAPLARVVEESLEAHQHLVAARSVALQCRVLGNPDVYVPRGLAGIVVDNLLRNAIANTVAGTVDLTVNGASLSVQDTGSGIPPEEIPRMFERGFRGRHSQGGEGLGLGLHIVKRICDRQGWLISASCPPDSGTCFKVQFTTKVQGT